MLFANSLFIAGVYNISTSRSNSCHSHKSGEHEVASGRNGWIEAIFSRFRDWDFCVNLYSHFARKHHLIICAFVENFDQMCTNLIQQNLKRSLQHWTRYKGYKVHAKKKKMLVVESAELTKNQYGRQINGFLRATLLQWGIVNGSLL